MKLPPPLDNLRIPKRNVFISERVILIDGRSKEMRPSHPRHLRLLTISGLSTAEDPDALDQILDEKRIYDREGTGFCGD